MENLAGRKDCNKYIANELLACGIELVRHPKKLDNEVPARITGKLGPFTFTREWYYWSVAGPMPLAAAEEMYADKRGVKDVRVQGHCGCPPPGEWATWTLPDGRRVVPVAEEKKIDAHIAYSVLTPEDKAKYAFSDDPKSIGAVATITAYHIDTLRGLKLFADTIRKHGMA